MVVPFLGVEGEIKIFHLVGCPSEMPITRRRLDLNMNGNIPEVA